MKKRFLFLFIITAGFLFVAGNAKALTLTPSRLEADIDPGQTKQYEVVLFNETDKDLKLTPIVESFTQKSEDGGTQIMPNDIANQSLGWINAPSSVALKSGEVKKIYFTISAPKTAEVGGYYPALIWQSREVSSKNGLAITSRVGTAILLTVNGETKQNLKIVDFKIKDSGNIYNFLPVDFVSRLENSGNVHLKPTGTILIKNMFGVLVKTLPYNSGGNNVLPQSVRQFDSVWNNGAKNKNNFFSAWARELHPSQWGMFSAKLDVEFGNPRQTAESATIKFWIIPWRTLIAVIIIIILIIIAASRKSFRKK